MQFLLFKHVTDEILVKEFDSFCRLLKKIIFGGPAPSLLYSNRPWKANRKSHMNFFGPMPTHAGMKQVCAWMCTWCSKAAPETHLSPGTVITFGDKIMIHEWLARSEMSCKTILYCTFDKHWACELNQHTKEKGKTCKKEVDERLLGKTHERSREEIFFASSTNFNCFGIKRWT